MHVKICCIDSPEEARLAIAAGAYALGLVGRMPSGPGVIPDERIAEIAAETPPHVRTFLLTSETEADPIIAHHHRTRTNAIQLVDHIAPSTFAHIRRALPGVDLVQVIHVRGPESIWRAMRAAKLADALLLDSGNPQLSVKQLGGTGRTHDWNISRIIVEGSPVPVFLAGGLKSHNVRNAVAKVRPFGLDVCTGVRSEGQLDPSKLSAFFQAVPSHL